LAKQPRRCTATVFEVLKQTLKKPNFSPATAASPQFQPNERRCLNCIFVHLLSL